MVISALQIFRLDFRKAKSRIFMQVMLLSPFSFRDIIVMIEKGPRPVAGALFRLGIMFLEEWQI